MLNINLDEEAERYLIEILKYEKTTISELIKQLLRERLGVIKPKQTVLERMGGVPKHLLAVGGLSDRDTRRNIIAARIQASYQAES
ncbi:MAG: hypothetical protein F6K19_26665 [Cyanothece sp. SIO1E1]|nr:hypothetical protein [Cyanothece sp. SIO1E1]